MRVRPGFIAAISLFAAVLGGSLALAIAKGAGWLGARSTTVVMPATPAEAGQPAPIVVAKPLVGNGFEPARIYRDRSAGVVTIVSYFDSPTSAAAQAGQGSGFVVSRDGAILTSAHVITTAGQNQTKPAVPARQIYVQFADGDRVSARIVGYDLFDDVGVIKVDPSAHALTPVPLGDSARLVVGQPVAAIGSPFGNADSLSVGVISAIRRSIPSLTTRYDLVDAIQTDAPINHGNSGGPLFDARGRAIGINAQIRSSGSTSGFEGVGFAVPIDSARRSLRQLLRTGHVSYAYVGIFTEDLTPSIAKTFGYAATRGALIDSVHAGPGRKAGLRAGTHDAVLAGEDVKVGGDVIVAIGSEPVDNAEDVVRIVTEQLLPGQTVKFSIVRGLHRLVVPVTLTTRPPAG